VGESSTDLPFLHTEQDIEIASRSADSTEDSVDPLSPGGQEEEFVFQEDGQSDTESSDSTETNSPGSQDSGADEDDDADGALLVVGDGPGASRGRSASEFKPIMPEIVTDAIEEWMKPRAKEGRRCKSEGDKASLHVVENVESFSREGSVSKFKPDGSWIKPPSEDDILDDVETAAENEFSATDTPADTSEGLWMAVHSDDNTTIGGDDKEDAKLKDSKESDVSKNVSPGTVIKQKQNIETKFGSGNTSTGKRLSENQSPSTDDSIKDTGNTHRMSTDSIPKPEIKVETPKEEDVESKCDLCQTDADSRRSVYEEEDIDLPQGIVRKTRLEIEEKQR